jgi:hypothetical protein
MDGPTGILLAKGANNSQSVFWAMAWEVDGAITIGSAVESKI